MSDLAATQCGGSCACDGGCGGVGIGANYNGGCGCGNGTSGAGFFGNSGCDSCGGSSCSCLIWIIILFAFCGNGCFYYLPR